MSATTQSPAEIDAATIEQLEERSRFIREEVIRLIKVAKVGHYASAFSCAEIIATLYYGVMSLRRGEPDWPQNLRQRLRAPTQRDHQRTHLDLCPDRALLLGPGPPAGGDQAQPHPRLR